MLRGVSINYALDESLAGSRSAAAITDSRDFRLRSRFGDSWESTLDLLYRSHGDVQDRGRRTLTLLDLFASAKPYDLPPENGAVYPGGAYGNALLQTAQYIKAGVGVEAVTINIGGWDHHAGESNELPPLLNTFARGLAAFRADLGARFADVVVVTMSEFGRTAAENGTGGTDHGRANVMFLAGGGVNGGRVYGAWPGLAEPQRDTGDLAITTDYRDVLGDVLAGRFGLDPRRVFDDHGYRPQGMVRSG